jgi:hypothetical protein
MVVALGPHDGIERDWLERCRDLEDTIGRESGHRRHDRVERFFPGREQRAHIQ